MGDFQCDSAAKIRVLLLRSPTRFSSIIPTGGCVAPIDEFPKQWLHLIGNDAVDKFRKIALSLVG